MAAMYSKSILILGDSTSMSIGIEKKTYPFLLANETIWPEGTRIINCSLPGITSADAASFFFSCRGPWFKSLAAVVIFLGNCDSASSEIRKGKYNYLQQASLLMRRFARKRPTKTRLKNRLLHYEWSNNYNPSIEKPENPNHFEYNINRIIQVCKRKSVPVILVRPKPNHYFPPGVGKGNFVFYRHLSIKEKLSGLISIPDHRFKEALRMHELGQFEKAAGVYKEIMLQAPETPMSQEYPLLVLNNYAVAMAESGQKKEALYLFQLLLMERGARKEITLFNLAQIHKMCGAKEDYARILEESFDSDESMYRVRSPYTEAIDRLTASHPSVRSVNMESLIPDELYLDHCHPLPEGQIRLAKEIGQHLKEIGVTGKEKASVENMLYNPELALGNFMKFHEYFKTFAPLQKRQIANAIKVLETGLKGKNESDSSLPSRLSLPKEIRKAIDYYLRHPYFTSIHDVVRYPPCYPSDVGRFPEYFIVRHLIPYLRAHESDPVLSGRFDPSLALLRASEQMRSILPAESAGLVDSELPAFDPAYEEIRLPLLLGKVRRLLLRHLQCGSQIFERIKTTIFWYVREALRFGAHSRVSMLYDRLLIEFLAEGLAVAGYLDSKLGLEKASEIQDLIRLLESVVRVHEQHCSRFSLSSDNGQLLLSYDRQLAEIASQLDGSDSAAL